MLRSRPSRSWRGRAIAIVVALIVVTGCGAHSTNDNGGGTSDSQESSVPASASVPVTVAVRTTTPTTATAATTPSTACPPGESTQIDFSVTPPRVVGCGPALPPPPSTIAPAPSSGVQAPVGTHDFGGDQFQTGKHDGYIP